MLNKYQIISNLIVLVQKGIITVDSTIIENNIKNCNGNVYSENPGTNRNSEFLWSTKLNPQRYEEC